MKSWKKHCIWIVLALIVVAVISCGCGGGSSSSPAVSPKVPGNSSSGVIPYPDGIELGGAAAYQGANNHLDSRYFVTTNDWFTQESTSTLTILSGFHTYQQTTEYNCGPASILMVLYHFGERGETEAAIGEAVEANDTVGTTVENLRDFFVRRGWQVESHVSTEAKFTDPDEFSEFARARLAAGEPIFVNWTRWNGHWEVLIGIDTMGTASGSDDVLIFADPYDTTDHFQDGYFVVGMEQFFYEWHEGLCAGKVEPYQHTYIIAVP